MSKKLYTLVAVVILASMALAACAPAATPAPEPEMPNDQSLPGNRYRWY